VPGSKDGTNLRLHVAAANYPSVLAIRTNEPSPTPVALRVTSHARLAICPIVLTHATGGMELNKTYPTGSQERRPPLHRLNGYTGRTSKAEPKSGGEGPPNLEARNYPLQTTEANSRFPLELA
jgi:hypothetical protein